MRNLIALALLMLSVTVFAQTKTVQSKVQIVEAACGQCMFDMEGRGCDLAVRIKGKAYWVDGTGLNDHGDAHAADGFCLKIRKAEVTGSLVDNRFKVTTLKVLPVEEQKVKTVQKKVKG